MNFYSVILAGGQGERLWPYSRKKSPKHLIPFLEGESLLFKTIKRCNIFSKNVWLVTSRQQKPLIPKFDKSLLQRIIVEPFSRNTGPAILLSAFYLFEHDRDALVAFLPADAYVPQEDAFAEYIGKAFNFAAVSQKICLLGLKPKFPATIYGYIESEASVKGRIYHVKKFHEKPTKDIAEQYLKDGNKFWNMGIFVGRVSSFIREYKLHAPKMYENVLNFIKQAGISYYEKIPKTSIDYAVMEKSSNITVLPVDFEWSDVGDLETFMSFKQRNKKFSNVVQLDSKENLVDVKDKLVALVGIKDVCVVEQDDVLLIVKRKKVGQVKDLVHLLKSNEGLK